MDNITHGILGARISGIILSEKHRTRPEPLTNGMLRAGALIANMPDIDVLINPFIPRSNQIDAFLFHRNLSHSLFFHLPIALLLGFIFSRIDRSKRTWRRRSLAVYFTVLIGHLLIDLMTGYGIRMLLPFTDLTFSVNNIAIVDFFFTGPLLLIFLGTLFSKTTAKKRKRARLGMAFAGVYLLSTIVIQGYVRKACATALISKNIDIESLLVQPEPLQPFFRRCVARTSTIATETTPAETWFLEEYTSLFDTSHKLFRGSLLHAYVQNTSLAQSLAGNYDWARLQEFSQGRRRLLPGPNGALIMDMLKFSGTRGRDIARGSKVLFGFVRDPATQRFSRYSNRGISITKEERNNLWSRVWGR